MNKTIDDHADRFDSMASTYDSHERPVYRACADIVIEAAAVKSDDVVLDLGAGTGAISLPLARQGHRVIARDISEEMLAEAKTKAADAELDNIDFARGSFREPAYSGDDITVVTTNYALHHLDDLAKREAIAKIAQYRPERFVLGDLMFFDTSPEASPEYNPDVDDPATVGVLARAITDVGFEITRIEQVTDQVGVLVAVAPRDGWPQ